MYDYLDPGEVPDSSAFPSPEYDRESREVSERQAELRAMPVRSIVSLQRNDTVATLSCGHRKALLVWLLVGDQMRCRECYKDGMRAARRMVEGHG
jgi:hypothetical protein